MMTTDIRYPIGVQSFKELRSGGYVYIDKTQYLPLLLRNKYYFLGRPRRFGKSLLLSTLEAYFRGEKELFEGLAVYEWEKEWLEYPVVHVDFNRMKGTDTDSLLTDLKKSLAETAMAYGLDISFWQAPGFEDNSIGYIFSRLIRELHAHTSRKVAVLIDEYDKGIIEVLDDEEKRMTAADALRPFFNVLKSDDEYIRFAFVTGVSRFRNTTIFSGANNLSDISMDARYATLLGITQQEMLSHFSTPLAVMSETFGWNPEDTVKTLQARYEGYRFTSARQYVYNPFSLLCAFDKVDLQAYWVESGSSRSLATYLKGSDFSLDDITTEWFTPSRLGSTYSREDPISLLFQTGYLTISDYDPDIEEYRLRIPNQEVQKSMTELLLPEFVKGVADKEINRWMTSLRKAVATGDIDTMMETLRALLAAVPYHHLDHVQEKHLHLCMQIVFLLLGVNTRSEIAVSGGRVDMLASTPRRIYL